MRHLNRLTLVCVFALMWITALLLTVMTTAFILTGIASRSPVLLLAAVPFIVANGFFLRPLPRETRWLISRIRSGS